MGLLDTFTGGKSDAASDALSRAEDYYSSIQAPSMAALTLPELQKYVEAGVLTPAQAQSYLQQNNALADQSINQTGTAAQISALNELSREGTSGDMGTPQEQAAMDAVEQNMNRSVGGQRGAIENAMAARGTPAALIQAALENQTVGQDAQQAHMDAVNAQAAAYQNALSALSQAGQLGGQIQGQQNTQANTVANAANAMQQFNAANQQQTSQFNAANQQQANAYNTQNKQQVANNNVGQANARTQYNAALPQQMYNNELAKAAGMSGAATSASELAQKQGQQNAGLVGGLINTGATVIGGMYGGPAGAVAANKLTSSNDNTGGTANAAHGAYVGHDHSICMAHGGYCMAEGGSVPGDASVAGDSLMNDMVPINASPGEVVIPRSSVAQHPEVVAHLMGDQDPGPQIDFQDVGTLLKALRAIRMGAV